MSSAYSEGHENISTLTRPTDMLMLIESLINRAPLLQMFTLKTLSRSITRNLRACDKIFIFLKLYDQFLLFARNIFHNIFHVRAKIKARGWDEYFIVKLNCLMEFC